MVDAGTYDGDWKGATSQDQPIAFRISGDRVVLLRFGYTGAGAGCSVEGSTSSRITEPVSDASFTVSSSGTSSWEVTGTFDTTEAASGALTFSSSTTCSFTAIADGEANLLPPAPSYDGNWSGETSQGQPISLVVVDDEVTSIDVN